MFLDRGSPWVLKALVIGLLWVSRSPGPLHLQQVMQQAAGAGMLQFALLAPSIVLPVRDRCKTTRLISESTIMASVMCLVLYASATQRVTTVDAAVILHLCTLHVLYCQTVEMQKGRRLLAGEQHLAWAALFGSVCLPVCMVQQTPGEMPGLGSMIVVLFSGEFLGTVASLIAAVIAALGAEYQAVMTGRE